MSKLKQPVFEKPEEPDFIKRLKHGHLEETKKVERPMTEAPAREDDLPAVENEISRDDLVKLRSMYGLKDNEAESVTEAEVTDLRSPESRPLVKKNNLAELGSGNGSSKRQRKIQDLRAKQEKGQTSLNEIVVDEARMVGGSSQKDKPSKSVAKRKKMKMSFED